MTVSIWYKIYIYKQYNGKNEPHKNDKLSTTNEKLTWKCEKPLNKLMKRRDALYK